MAYFSATKSEILLCVAMGIEFEECDDLCVLGPGSDTIRRYDLAEIGVSLWAWP